VTIRLDDDEAVGLKLDAAKAGMTVEGYLRAIMFDYPIRRVADPEGVARVNAVMNNINCLGRVFQRLLEGDAQLPPHVTPDSIVLAVEGQLKRLDEVVPSILLPDPDL
jgi:hypothetical protein